MKKNQNFIVTALLFCLLLPAVSFATNVRDILISVGGIVKMLIPVSAGIGVVYFFWGVVQFVINAGNEKTRADGEKKMLWGVVAIAVIFSIGGIIALLGSIVGTSTGGSGSGSSGNGGPCIVGSQTDLTGPCTGD